MYMCIHKYILHSQKKDIYNNRKANKDQTVQNQRNRLEQQIQSLLSLTYNERNMT